MTSSTNVFQILELIASSGVDDAQANQATEVAIASRLAGPIRSTDNVTRYPPIENGSLVHIGRHQRSRESPTASVHPSAIHSCFFVFAHSIASSNVGNLKASRSRSKRGRCSRGEIAR